VGDYLKYNSQESDRHLCDGIGEKWCRAKRTLSKDLVRFCCDESDRSYESGSSSSLIPSPRCYLLYSQTN
jgi:hypothetical protein